MMEHLSACEVERVLTSDSDLRQYFNQYLALPIFPIHLYLDDDTIIEVSVCDQSSHSYAKDTQPNVYNELMEWISDVCWHFFIKSILYCKYRLCANFREVIADINFAEFVQFEQSLKWTIAAPLIEIWVTCEANSIGIKQTWTQPHVIRTLCNNIPFLSKIVTRMGDHWIQYVKDKILHRLKWYWLPRYFQLFPRVISKIPVMVKRDFYNGLVFNNISGDPFSNFLSRQPQPNTCNNQHLFWQDCHLLLSKLHKDHLLKPCWRLWNKYLAPSSRKYIEVDDSVRVAFHTTLQSGRVEEIHCLLTQLQNDVFSMLKRLWTLYLKQLYSSYTKCLALEPQQHNTKASKQTKTTFNTLKKKQIDPKILLPSDLVGIFEPLDDIETFLQFEHFVYISRGPLSEENAYLRLWKAIRRHSKTVEKDKRESLAIAIYKNFISDQSKYGPLFSQSLLDGMEEGSVAHNMPTTPVLTQLQHTAEQNLDELVKQFVMSIGEGKPSLSEVQKKAHLLSIALAINKKRSNSQLQEDSSHLYKTLSLCEGAITHKLQAFSDYLVEYAYSSSPAVMANSVQFWLEVNKLKGLYSSDASIQILHHKAEALVDRYLDTVTPPWIKITIPPETATVIVSAVQELNRSKVLAVLNDVMNLFENAQQRVFSDMVPYWGSFCKTYKSPIESTVSLPQVVSLSSAVTSRKASRTLLPPLLQARENAAPLLSYSKMMGLKWKGIFQ